MSEHPTGTPRDPRIGTRIDAYRIEAVLGRGGMGTVYRAVDEGLDKVVAIKMLDARLLNNARFLRRFESEPRLQARLNSPHIVQVYAFRRIGDDLVMVMEYVDGETLADRLKRKGMLPRDEALGLFGQLLDAVEHAHQVGVIHRDLKPGNVLIDRGGIVKVVDFGLAKLQESGDQTRTRSIAGTLKYMPPEQVRGLTHVDHRGDIYALGIVLYQLLAGRVPFRKDSGEYDLLKAVVESPPPPPERFNPDLPPALSAVIMTAIAKDPEARFPSVGAFRAALAAARGLDGGGDDTAIRADADRTVTQLAGESASVPDPSVAADSRERTVRDPGPPRRVWAGLLGAAGVIAVVLMGWGMLSGNSSPSRDAGRTAPLETSLPVLPDSATMVLTSRPAGATVWLDGDSLGRTPLTLRGTADSALPIRLTLSGHADWSDTLTLASGDTLQREAVLAERRAVESRPRRGTLAVTIPPRTTLEVNGAAIDTETRGPARLTLAAGEHHLALIHPVYGRHEHRLTLEAGETRTLAVALFQKVSIHSDPWGTLWIDGRETAETTPVELDLPAGRHEIEVRRTGYWAEVGPVVVDVDPFRPRRHTLSVRLSPF